MKDVYNVAVRILPKPSLIKLLSSGAAGLFVAQCAWGQSAPTPGPQGAPLPGSSSQSSTASPAASPKASSLPDYTDRLALLKGISIVFPIYDGVDTHRKKIGDYQFVATVDDVGLDGFSFKWTMSTPADAAGLRAVAPEDEKQSHQVSLFYSKGQSCTYSGFTNTVRVSDAIYNDLKAGRTTPFQIDLEDRKDIPSRLRPEGTEKVDIYVDGKKAQVRTIRAVTNNGWRYWIMDNPEFPVMVKGDGPFRWSEPRFSFALAESRRLTDELQKNGVASTTSILFAFNSAKLEPSANQILDGIATFLKKQSVLRLMVEGHCDNVGSPTYNLKLSDRRAASVKQYLVRRGIPSHRLECKGFGFSQPVSDNYTEVGRSKNRRVVFKKID